MRVGVWVLLGLSGLTHGCSSKVLHDDVDDPDGGELEASGGRGSGGAASTGGTQSAGDGGALATGGRATGGNSGAAPNPACPGVFAEPFSDASRDDVGPRGLAALRAQVVESQATFRAYATQHGGTYTYTRQGEYMEGFCETKISVTNNVVTSARERSIYDGFTTNTTRTGNALDDPSCHPAVTMDALYEECLTKTLCQDPRENRLYLHIDARGLLVQCGFFPVNCADDCYQGLEPAIVTADGKDWTKPLPGCCEPSPEPDCCMNYGGPGTVANNACGTTCDGMPTPNEPGWNIVINDSGCVSWEEPRAGSTKDCCGCGPPAEDAGAH
jgi:hypothetical protein